ncbi:TolC family protein [Geobacter sulfurreducens]|uniref:Efflux pump, RND family, outer membrane protein n=2 Tax=Geobacter sulfurreducens TaxID=35554 RepID=Q74GG8_GEOSL|nr:efflux pump, RND family, outer membrane protein [Geobacter sulfurreducens PCA]ADI83112.2 efflux pump, RND family, outer membrane protein [Geobacter sulfurreducens KN400]AJY70006.1 RND transporter [Geobacter sulfurreducens]QVW35546.1 TolC family protein [Geobacter sulfurreducens]UAC04369.1 TolC family protein [Geobacter sulfurreducens]
MGSVRTRVLGAVIGALCLAATAWGQEAPMTGDGLDVALNFAAIGHPSIKSQVAELKALGSDLKSAEYKRYPALTIQAQTMTNNQNQVVAVVQQPLWVGGRIDGGIEQADVGLRIGRAALLDVRRRVMEETSAAYATLRGALQRLKAAELNVGEHEKLKGLVSRRVEGGVASNADILLAESRLSQAIAQRIQLKGAVSRARSDLLALTQQPVAGNEPVPAHLLELPEPERMAEMIVKTSATVEQRILKVEDARITSRLAVASMMPALYAKVEQNVYVAERYGETPHETRFGVVLQGSVEGLGLSGWKKVKASDSRIDAARKEVAAAENDVRRQAEALVTDILSLRQVVRSYELLVTSTEETLASFLRQYDAGRKSWVDVLNAQREFSEARISLEQARSSLEEASLRLAARLGQLDSFTGGNE